MDILDEYKKQAEKKRQDLEQATQKDSGLYQVRNMQVISALQHIHNYLHELIEQLNFVKPDTRTNMQIGSFGEFNELLQGEYRLSNDSTINKEVISLLFSVTSDEPLEVEIENSLEQKEECEQLKSKGLLLNYISRKPDKVSIQAYIPVSIEFGSDFSESGIHVSIKNFSQLGAEQYRLNTDTIDETLLDKLGRFILRVDSDFMNILTEDSQGISVNEQKSPVTNKDVVHTEELDMSRLRSLFNREQRIYLTYQNLIRDVGSRNREFVLGRAKDCDLTIQSDLASRHHAQLVFRKGKFVLIDQSTNGTFVKPQGGKETYVQSEEYPLAGSGFISLGKAVTVDNDHLIYYNCQ